MNNKYKLPLVLFLFSMIFTIIGALFKIQHWPGASILLIIGLLSQAFAIFLLIVVLLKKSK
ncbi:GldL-related protein [Flavobacterium sp. RSB2_4_14]|uniref:GldL-related protein n=1 Tax=Flavobacterium sp. RSB2_4_14 TaxID=3447665 RepID=UPI003F3581F5